MTNDYHIPRPQPKKPNKQARVGYGHRFKDRHPEKATILPDISIDVFQTHQKAGRLPPGAVWTCVRGALAPEGWTQQQADEWAKEKHLKQETKA